jgi:soluble lytic murein transglycosylase-like protein
MTPAALLVLFAAVSQTFNLPQGLLASVCFVESSYDIEATNVDDGDGDSLGVCQVKVETARTLGFLGTAVQLKNPRVNSYYAGKYLHHQLRRYGGNLHKAVASYNSGTWRINAKGQTANQRYVNKVMKVWKEQKK